MAEEGAGGKEVGRISIRVVPNTDRFREDLQRQLEALEKDAKVKVKVDPDLDDFREKVKAQTAGLKDAKVKVKTEFDRRGDMIHDLDSELNKGARPKVKVDPVLGPRWAEAKAAAGAEGVKMDVTPNIQASSFEKALRDVKAQAKLADVKLGVNFKDEQAERRLAELIEKLKLEAKLANIKLDIQGPISNATSLLGDAGGGGGHAFGNLRLLADQSILIGVAIVAFLAPALAVLSTALVSLPALIAAVAAPLGVFALGLGGIKKALDDSGFLKLVSTNKKGGTKQSLGDVIKDIQKPIEDVFEKGFTPLFQQVALTIPALTKGLPFIAQGIVNFATGIVRAMTSVPNLERFDRFTNSVGTMLTNLAPGITAFTNGMIRLTSDVADHLPGLGNVLSSWADRFSNWVAKIDQPRANGKPSILDSAVTNLKPVLNSIVGFVGRLLDAGIRLGADPQMAANIEKFINSLTNFIVNTLPETATVFKSIADSLDKISRFAGVIKQGAGQTKGDQRAQNDATNVIGKDNPFAGSRSGSWENIIAQMVPGVGPLMKRLFDEIRSVNWSGVFDGLKKEFAQLVVAVTTTAGRIMAEVRTWPGKIKAALGDTAHILVSAGLALVRGFVDGIIQGVGAQIGRAVSAVTGMLSKIRGLFPHSPAKEGPFSGDGWVYGSGQSIGQAFNDGLKDGFQGVINSAHELMQRVHDAMSSGTQGIGSQFGKDIQQQLKALDVERDQLRAQRDGTADKGQRKAIDSQIAQLNAARDQLNLQKDQLGYTSKYGGLADQKQMQEQLGQSVNKMIDIGKNFAMANVSQFESDIGISGKGALPTLLNTGVDWATGMLGQLASGALGGQGGTHIHVNSVDEALAAKQTLENRQALTYNAGR